MEKIIKRVKAFNFLIALLALTLIMPITAHATSILYGITGDGANTSETLFQLSQTDASSTFFMTLGNGNDGEAIAYNPDDGFMYHASGISNGDRYWEQINLNTASIASSVQQTGPDVRNEVISMTADPSSSGLLVVDRQSLLFSATSGGVFTTLGPTNYMKGIAFSGGILYGLENGTDSLWQIDPLTGALSNQLSVTLAGFSVFGFNGLATHPDTDVLWGILQLSSIGAGSGRGLATINSTTGAASLVGFLDDRYAGIAFVPDAQPIPEPATMLLLGTGLVGVAGAARRRKKNQA